MKIKYIGQKEEIYIPNAGISSVKRGDIIDVPEGIAESLMRGGNFQKAEGPVQLNKYEKKLKEEK